VSDPVFDPVLSFNMRVYRGVVSTEYISAVSVRFSPQLYWLFQLVPVIFTYLRADCRCYVTTGSGRVGSGQSSNGHYLGNGSSDPLYVWF